MPNHWGLAGCQGSSRKNYNQEQTTYPSNLDYKYTAPNYSTRVHNLRQTKEKSAASQD